MLNTEMSVIGCLVMEPALLDQAKQLLSPRMFEEEPLARIYSCMLKLKKAGLPVDVVTVVQKLGDQYTALMKECADCAPSLSAFDTYAGMLLDDWRRRKLLEELQLLEMSGKTADEMTAELEKLAAYQREIMRKVRGKTERTFLEAVGETYLNLFKPDTSLRADWEDFNEKMGGLQRGELYIIAARPGDGKTDFSLHLAVMLAKKYKVDYRSLEMSTEQLTHRILSRACIINSKKFRDHEITEEEQKRIAKAVELMKDLHLVIDDTPGISVEDIENKAAALKPDIMFIDYLGLMKGDDNGKKPLWQITGEITHGLKSIAKRFNIVVVALVQLSREADKTKTPSLSDLKGGSDIEADAGGVIFMRPDKTDEFLTGSEVWPVEAIIAKNRHGGTGNIKFYWQPQYHRYLSGREAGL